MNSIDYKNYMEQNKRIESVESARCLANAMRLQQNIKVLKNADKNQLRKYAKLGINVERAVGNYQNEKEAYIKLAMERSLDKEQAIENFGELYEIQIKELIHNLEPNVAAIGGI